MRSLTVLTVLLATAPAFADLPPPPGYPPMSHSADSYDLYYELRTYDWGCPRLDEATKRAKLVHTLDVVKKIADASDRGQFDKWATKLKVWFDAYAAGIPGTGTWAELEARAKTAQAALDAMPAAIPTQPEAIKAAIAAYQTIRTQAPAIAKISAAVNDTPCAAYPASWPDLAYKLDLGVKAADLQVRDGTRDLLGHYRAWKATIPAGGALPDTYWEHVAGVKAMVDFVGASVALQPEVTLLAAWAPALAGDDATAAAEAPELLARSLAAAGPKIASVLPAVAMPPLGQNAGRTALVDKAVAGLEGKRLGIVVSAGTVSNQTWNEDVVVRQEGDKQWVRNYVFVREYYTTYYAWRPTKQLAVPGLDPGEVCEIWSQNFTRYTKGGPSVEGKKNWFASENAKEGYLPCKSAGVASKKSLK